MHVIRIPSFVIRFFVPCFHQDSTKLSSPTFVSCQGYLRAQPQFYLKKHTQKARSCDKILECATVPVLTFCAPYIFCPRLFPPLSWHANSFSLLGVVAFWLDRPKKRKEDPLMASIWLISPLTLFFGIKSALPSSPRSRVMLLTLFPMEEGPHYRFLPILRVSFISGNSVLKRGACCASNLTLALRTKPLWLWGMCLSPG